MLSDQPSVEDRIKELADNSCVPSEDLKNITVEFQQQNPIFRRELERCDIPSYDAILVLTETRPGSEGLTSDSRSIITLLLCRDISKQATKELGAVTYGHKMASTKQCIIAE